MTTDAHLQSCSAPLAFRYFAQQAHLQEIRKQRAPELPPVPKEPRALPRRRDPFAVDDEDRSEDQAASGADQGERPQS